MQLITNNWKGKVVEKIAYGDNWILIEFTDGSRIGVDGKSMSSLNINSRLK